MALGDDEGKVKGERKEREREREFVGGRGGGGVEKGWLSPKTRALQKKFRGTVVSTLQNEGK